LQKKEEEGSTQTEKERREKEKGISLIKFAYF
jgi:hypothetical protein